MRVAVRRLIAHGRVSHRGLNAWGVRARRFALCLPEVSNGSAGSEVDNEESASAGGGKKNKRAVIKISTADKPGE